jgi:hypothetical protein
LGFLFLFIVVGLLLGRHAVIPFSPYSHRSILGIWEIILILLACLVPIGLLALVWLLFRTKPRNPGVPATATSQPTSWGRITLIVLAVGLLTVFGALGGLALVRLWSIHTDYGQPMTPYSSILLPVMAMGSVGVFLAGLVAIWLLLRTKPKVAGQPQSGGGGTGRTVLIILLALAGLVVLLVLLAGGAFFLARSRASQSFQVNAVTMAPPIVTMPPTMPTMPVMPAMPAMPSMPAIPPMPANPALPPPSNGAGLDALTERVRQELDASGIRFDQLQVSSPDPNQLLVSPTRLEARDADSWHPIIGFLRGDKILGGGWHFLGQGELGIAVFDVIPLDRNQVLADAASRVNPPQTSPSANPAPLADRLQAAEKIMDLNIRDKSLAFLAEEAAATGDAGTTRSALHKIMDLSARDPAVRNCAILLAKAGARADAVQLAMTIMDINIRDATLAELAK